MKHYIRLLALSVVALIGCQHDVTPTSHRVGINLGKQTAVIALAAGNNNDVQIAPNGSTTTMLRFTVNASGSTLTGMNAATVSDGDLFVVRNESTTGTLTLTNDDSLSVAANRFLTAGAVPIVIQPKSGALVEYDGTATRFMATVASASAPTFTGNVVANGSAIPVQSSCGTSPSITAGATDFSGTFAIGSGATTCTLTFATAFSAAPTCVVLNASGAATLVPTYTTSTTALTISTGIASTTYQYVCVGH